MLEMHYHEASQGIRNKNLDVIGHASGDNWSFSYLLDGFPEGEPHYVHILSSIFESKLVGDCENPTSMINMLMQEVDRRAFGKASAVFILCIGENMKIFANGDSRAYIPTLPFQTKDHTLLQEHIDNGKIKDGDASYKFLFNSFRKVLTKQISPGSTLDDMIIQYDGTAKDVWICSDGFWSELSSCPSDINSPNQLKNIFRATEYKDNSTVAYLKLAPSLFK